MSVEIIPLLRDSRLDWHLHETRGANNTIWAKPIYAERPMSEEQILEQPMYPLRKLLAKASNCKTSQLSPTILDGLSAIESGEAGYQWAFSTTYDAWKMTQKWEGRPAQIQGRPKNIFEHKHAQLFDCFPLKRSESPAAIAIFVGQGICVIRDCIEQPAPAELRQNGRT